VRRYYPDGRWQGQHVLLNDDAARDDLNLEIVGVVKDTKYVDPREASKELVYFALNQSRGSVSGGSYVVRLSADADPATAFRRIRGAIEGLAPGIGVGIRPYGELFDNAIRRDRMIGILSGAFGALGVLLACVGLYGIMTQAVRTRTAEIGVRTALGARSWQVQWLVLREALVLVAAGIAAGVPTALLSSRLVGSLLYGLTPADPAVSMAAVLLMLLVTLAAAWIPARRAARVDPLTALRQE
jgi:ABC-type antimicrobial peptide transport system permease subunit